MTAQLDILVVSQFFAPEMGAPAARFHDFGRLLVAKGHRVTILTGFPNSPSGVIPEPYRGRVRHRETIDGIDVVRGWLYASPRLTKWTKTAGFASFGLSASAWAVLGNFSPDVVIGTSPPPSVGIPAMLAATRLGVPMVFDVRDIWPEAIAGSGRLRNPLVIRGLELIERTIYRRAAAVTVVTDGKRERLLEKGVPESKLAVIPNGVDLGRFENIQDERSEVLGQYGIDPKRFIVLYAGIFNPPQGLDVLLDAAKILGKKGSHRDPAVEFVLVGNGSERSRLAQRIENESLSSVVHLVDEQPRDRIPPLLRAADAIAITLRRRNDSHTVPSKIYESMASGRPILVSADGAPSEIVLQTGAGLASPAEDAPGLAQSIQQLREDPEAAASMGRRGTEHAKSFDRRRLVERFEEVLQRVVHAGRSSP